MLSFQVFQYTWLHFIIANFEARISYSAVDWTRHITQSAYNHMKMEVDLNWNINPKEELGNTILPMCTVASSPSHGFTTLF